MAERSINIGLNNERHQLSEREREILTKIIHLYILNASPVGSRNLSRYFDSTYRLSPATIRNVMADLEEMDYISHPHTSAGRVPTDKGYRFYVDSLNMSDNLTENEISTLHKRLTQSLSPEEVLKDASKVLGLLSNYLGVVAFPHLTEFVIQKIELIALSSSRLLVVIALESNIVRTVTLEAEFDINQRHLEDIATFINEKMTGKTLGFVKDNFGAIINDYRRQDAPLIRLFIDSVDRIFDRNSNIEKVHVAGAHNLLEYSDSEDLMRVKGIIELVENEDMIIHLLDKIEDSENGIKVLIGNEIDNAILRDYSMVVSKYRIGGAGSGSIGIIGPKRMNYSRMIALVSRITEDLSLSK